MYSVYFNTLDIALLFQLIELFAKETSKLVRHPIL